MSAKREREASELASASVRLFRALARRAGQGELEALEALHMLEDSLQLQLGAAVAGYREFRPAHNAEPYSWADVGRALGTTRQAAQQRFRTATVAPAWPASSCVCDPGKCNPLECHHCADNSVPEWCPHHDLGPVTL
jgi:hypothetical protein